VVGHRVDGVWFCVITVSSETDMCFHPQSRGGGVCKEPEATVVIIAMIITIRDIRDTSMWDS